MPSEIPMWLEEQTARSLIEARQALWRIDHRFQRTGTGGMDGDLRLTRRALANLINDLKYVEEFRSGSVMRRVGGEL